MIANDRVNDVFNELFSEPKQDFFNSVKAGKHQIIIFEELIKLEQRNLKCSPPI